MSTNILGCERQHRQDKYHNGILLPNHLEEARIWQTDEYTDEYNEVGWVLLLLLDEVGKDKNELRNTKSQLKHHGSDLKASTCALMEILASCGHRAETAGHQAQNLFLWLAELQPKWNTQAPRCLL